MNIEILQLIAGARQAKGLTVIIDVFRAFSVEPYLFDAGVGAVFAVGKPETALRLREEHPDVLLLGERGGVRLPDFDYGNSPSQIDLRRVKGRTVVHTTGAGTQGIVNAVGADEIITGSLVNATAVADYIRRKDPEQVSLVCMGVQAKSRAPEDLLAARYIRAQLLGGTLDMEEELQKLRPEPSAAKFFDPDRQEVFPEEDYYMCTDTDRFDFVLRVEPAGEDCFSVQRVQADE